MAALFDGNTPTPPQDLPATTADPSLFILTHVQD
jgi:hypothetical protein